MKIVIGNLDNNMKLFLKKYSFNDKVILANKICNIKYIKTPVDIVIPFSKILNSGLLSNTMVHFEELLITLNINKVYYGNYNNKDMMEKFSKEYGVDIEYIDYSVF